MGMPSRQFQKNRESAREAANESAYIKGIQETSGLEKGLYIDPDKLDINAPDIVQKFVNQLDEQIPGAADAMLAKYNDGRDVPISMRELAANILSIGPAAGNFTIDGEKYGLAVLPNSDLDTKEELIRAFLPSRDEDAQDKIISNMPGNDKDWNRRLVCMKVIIRIPISIIRFQTRHGRIVPQVQNLRLRWPWLGKIFVASRRAAVTLFMRQELC